MRTLNSAALGHRESLLALEKVLLRSSNEIPGSLPPPPALRQAWATNSGCTMTLLKEPIYSDKASLAMREGIWRNTISLHSCALCVLTHFISDLSPNSLFMLYTAWSTMCNSINVQSYSFCYFPLIIFLPLCAPFAAWRIPTKAPNCRLPGGPLNLADNQESFRCKRWARNNSQTQWLNTNIRLFLQTNLEPRI